MSLSFWRELFDPEEPESYGQRIQALAFELVVVLRAEFELWNWAKIIPSQPGIPQPTGLATLLDLAFMLNDFAAKANVALVGVFLLLGLTQRLRAGYLLAFVGFHLQYVVRFGLGKTQHSTNMLGFAMLALAVAHVAYTDPVLRRKASIGLTVLLMSAGYLLAAGSKWRSRGLRWADGHNLWLWVREKRIDTLSAAGKPQLNFAQRLVLKNVYLATFFLAGGLLAETASTLMWWRRCRRWVMLALAGMHLGISVVMNIQFTANVLILLSLALPIAELVDFVRARRAVAASSSPTLRA